MDSRMRDRLARRSEHKSRLTSQWAELFMASIARAETVEVLF